MRENIECKCHYISAFTVEGSGIVHTPPLPATGTSLKAENRKNTLVCLLTLLLHNTVLSRKTDLNVYISLDFRLSHQIRKVCACCNMAW